MRCWLAVTLATAAATVSAQEREAGAPEVVEDTAVEDVTVEDAADGSGGGTVEPAASAGAEREVRGAAVRDPATASPQAAAAPGTPSVRRTAVLVVAASDRAESAADALTEVLIGAVASRGGVEIVGKEEVQSLLHQEEARSLECVTSPPCLGRLGVQLRVAEAVVGLLDVDGDRWSLDLIRLDVRSGTVLGRVFREVEGSVGAVASALLDSTQELYRPRPVPARLRFAANVPARVLLDGAQVGVFEGRAVSFEDLDPGEVELRAEPLNPGYRPWVRRIRLEAGADVRVEASLERAPSPQPPTPAPPSGARLSPLLWVGAGVAAVGSAVALGFGVRSRRSVPSGANRAEALAFVDERRRDAAFANGGLGVLGVGLSVAVVGLLLSDFDGSAPVRAAVVPEPAGAAVVIRGAL